MSEIPEHLLKRAQAAREKAESSQEPTDNASPTKETNSQTTVAVADESPIQEIDEKAEEILERISKGLGQKLISSHIAPNRGLWKIGRAHV